MPELDEDTGKRENILQCPVCKKKYRSRMPMNLLDEDDDGIGVVLIEPPCTHKFIVFVDKNLKVRGYEKIEYEGITVEHADSAFIADHIKELEKQHELALRHNYNEAFELMKEIKKQKRKYARMTRSLEWYDSFLD